MSGPLSFPLRLDGTGRAASADRSSHIRDLVELVLLTDPGERVMRPDFGCGVKSLVFAPMDDVLAAATQSLIHAQLTQWLDDVVSIDSVQAESSDIGQLTVTVAYRIRVDGTSDTTQVVVTV
jgi:phage baseplate assembly protein W